MTVAAATQGPNAKKRGARRPPIPVPLNSALSTPIELLALWEMARGPRLPGPG